MSKVIFFKKGSNWLDKTVTIKYRKLGLITLCVLPVVIVASVARVLYGKVSKDLETMDITAGWGDNQVNDDPDPTVADEL